MHVKAHEARTCSACMMISCQRWLPAFLSAVMSIFEEDLLLSFKQELLHAYLLVFTTQGSKV